MRFSSHQLLEPDWNKAAPTALALEKPVLAEGLAYGGNGFCSEGTMQCIW